MSLYGPLTDAFSEFNKLLIGQQEWKGKQAMNEQSQRRSDLMLKSQIVNQEFQHEMARSKHGLSNLRYLGDREDAASNVRHQKEMEAYQARMAGVAEQNAGTAAAAQIATNDHYNAIEEHQAATLEETKDQNYANQIQVDRVNTRAETLQTANLAHTAELTKQAKYKNDEFEKLHTPTEINASTITSLSPEVWDRPEAMDMMERVSGGLRISPDDGLLYNATTGEPANMTVSQFNREVLPRIQSVVTAYDNKPTQIQERVGKLGATIENLEATGRELKKSMGMSASAKGKSALAYNNAQINQLKGKMANEQAKLSKPSQIAYWQDKAEDMMHMAHSTASDTNISALYAGMADNFSKKAESLLDAKQKRELAATKAGVGGKGDVTAGNRISMTENAKKQIQSKYYTPGQISPIRAWHRAGASAEKKMFTDRVAQMQENGAVFNSSQEYDTVAEIVHEEMRTIHNTYLQRKKEFEGKRPALIEQAKDRLAVALKRKDPNIIKKAKANLERVKTIKLKYPFDYEPTKSFRIQMMGKSKKRK